MNATHAITANPTLRLVERVLFNRAGEPIRAIFLVGYVNGEPHIKLVSAERVPTIAAGKKSARTPALCGACERESSEQEADAPQPIPSPYFSEVDAFFVSQMPRAPSLAAHL